MYYTLVEETLRTHSLEALSEALKIAEIRCIPYEEDSNPANTYTCMSATEEELKRAITLIREKGYLVCDQIWRIGQKPSLNSLTWNGRKKKWTPMLSSASAADTEAGKILFKRVETILKEPWKYTFRLTIVEHDQIWIGGQDSYLLVNPEKHLIERYFVHRKLKFELIPLHMIESAIEMLEGVITAPYVKLEEPDLSNPLAPAYYRLTIQEEDLLFEAMKLIQRLRADFKEGVIQEDNSIAPFQVKKGQELICFSMNSTYWLVADPFQHRLGRTKIVQNGEITEEIFWSPRPEDITNLSAILRKIYNK